MFGQQEENNTKKSDPIAKEEFIVAGLNLAQMEEFITKGFPGVETVRKKDVIITVGMTGAGKSTTIAYLTGAHVVEEHNLSRPSQPYAVVSLRSGEKPSDYPTISKKMKSETSFPQVYIDKNSKQAYCDCPGFEDTGTDERRVGVAILTRLAIEMAASIKFMVVINSDSLGQRGIGMRDLCKTLSLFLKKIDKTVEGSIVFVITCAAGADKQAILKDIKGIIINEETKLEKLNNKIENLEKRTKEMEAIQIPDFLKKQFKEEKEEVLEQIDLVSQELRILKIIDSYSDNVMIIDVFDKGQSKKLIETQIASLKPIKKSKLQFGETEPKQVKFNEILFTAASRGTYLIRRALALPLEIASNQEQITDAEIKIKDYENYIKCLEKGNVQDEEKNIREINDKKRAEYQEKVKRCSDIVDAEQAVLDEKVKEFNECNSNERVKYMEYPIEDKRIFSGRLGRFLGICTRERFVYDGIPYIEVRVTENHREDEVKYERDDKENGKCVIYYKSRPGEDGKAKITVEVAKKDLPRCKNKRELLDKEIKDLQNKLNGLRKNLQEAQNEYKSHEVPYTAYLKEGEDKEKNIKECLEEFGISQAQQLVRKKELEQANQALEAELKEIRAAIEADKPLYDIINKIASLKPEGPEFSLLTEFSEELARLEGPREVKIVEENSDPYRCPIGKNIMEKPVITKCGDTFDKKNLLQFIATQEASNKPVICPCCNNEIKDRSFSPNLNLEKLIKANQNSKNKHSSFLPKISIFSSNRDNNNDGIESLESPEALAAAKLNYEKLIDRYENEIAILERDIKDHKNIVSAREREVKELQSIKLTFEKELKQAKGRLIKILEKLAECNGENSAINAAEMYAMMPPPC